MKVWDLKDAPLLPWADFLASLDDMRGGVFSADRHDEVARLLTGVAKDKAFVARYLADLIAGSGRCAEMNPYSAQVFMLHHSKYYTIRLAIWEPAPRDVGKGFFAYDFPHDHDFNLFTLGFLGPGYVTSVYQYDYDACLGIPGESIDLRSIGDFQLTGDSVFLYEKNKDVHIQHPPEDVSVSLNIMQNTPAYGITERQYGFDVERGKILNRINKSMVDQLVNIGVAMDMSNVGRVAAEARSPTVRAASYIAMFRYGIDVLHAARSDPDAYVVNLVEKYLKGIEEPS